MNKALLLLLVFIFVILMDFIFLGLIMKNFYDYQLGGFTRNLRLWSGLMAWFLIAVGVVFLALPQAQNHYSAILYGALFGLVLYGVYDFTNYAILKDYKLIMVFVDWAWGTFLCASASLLAFFINSF